MRFFTEIKFSALLAVVIFLFGCSNKSAVEIVEITDQTQPSVSSTIPADLAADIAFNASLTATFSEEMDPLSITTASFTLQQGFTPIPGSVTYSGVTAVFTPSGDLAPHTIYTATITDAAKDMVGNLLAFEKIWTFTTSAAPDITPPTVSSTIPANAATGAAINGNISSTFSESMDPLTITAASFTLSQGSTPVTGTVTYAGVTAVFTPSSNLAYNTAYTAGITTAVKDLAGNSLAADKVWTFTTGMEPDITAPTVNITYPTDNETGTVVGGTITATFSEAMDPLTISNTTFSIKEGTTPVAGSVTYYGVTATFYPDSDLTHSTLYTATVTTGVQDFAGNHLAAQMVWSFTTAGYGPTPVNLRTAGNFVILATSGITAGAGTSIIGNIGVSPTGSTALVGFGLLLDTSGTFATSSMITGKAYASTYTAPTPDTLITAMNDMHTAYADASGRTGATDLGSGELGGRTITPGLYHWGAAVLITTDMTLNGGANDVWIFQINGALTMTDSIHVHLTGGAQAKNIFWQTVGAVSLGANVQFAGIVLSQAAITLGDGAEVHGRLFANTADTEGVGCIVAQP